jgi:2-polyprenyl-3-methyl-5-hydroxy-6-metoxy-1,4-benzoquinol methylase
VGNALQALPDETFDVVILSNVLEHLPERAAFLRHVQESLQPARLLVRVPLFERDWRVPLKREVGVEWRLDPTHQTEYTQESFAEEISAAGLEIAHQEVRWGELWAELRPASARSECS